VVLHFPHYLDAAGPPVQGVPDFQKDGFAVRPPLMVSKAHFFDAF
jgi:hypothetical protein